MGFLDNLKSIFNIRNDLSGLKEVRVESILNGNSLIRVDNSRIDNSKTLVINVSPTTLTDPTQAQALQSAIKSALNDDGIPVIASKAAAEIEDIASSNAHQSTIDYLHDKIPAEDLSILRAAMYMRSVHEKGQSVERLKTEIVQRHGQRGANITNLCSAGYFESYIIPMHKEFKERPNFSEQTFLYYYNQIIENAPFAVFVSRHNGADDVKCSIIEKITFNKNYGIKSLAVHAIGSENVKKVNDLLDDHELKELFTAPPAVKIEGNIISAQLFY